MIANRGSGWQNLDPSNAYVGMYGILVMIFIVLMWARGTCFHTWSLGSGNKLFRNALTR
jgi:hypothetical protein